MIERIAGLVVAAAIVAIAAALGVHVPHHVAPHHVSPFADCSSATIGTAACPGSTSAAGTTSAAHRR